MKKLTIGRNNACDIIIPDTSDLVSRRQAVLVCSFFGKMVLYDTSNNGTYVNGQRLDNGKGVKVTRKDKVNFARIADLDWKDVKDPYHKEKLISAICAALIVIASIILAIWFTLPEKEEISEPAKTETIEKGETTTTVQPQVVEDQPIQQSTKKAKKKKSNKRDNPVTPNDIMNKEVNENSPIVY